MKTLFLHFVKADITLKVLFQSYHYRTLHNSVYSYHLQHLFYLVIFSPEARQPSETQLCDFLLLGTKGFIQRQRRWGRGQPEVILILVYLLDELNVLPK